MKDKDIMWIAGAIAVIGAYAYFAKQKKKAIQNDGNTDSPNVPVSAHGILVSDATVESANSPIKNIANDQVQVLIPV